jgi:shikimate kinase
MKDSIKDKIYITGFMGAGKTTIAQRLARRLSYELIDLDDHIERGEGASPQILIDKMGEAHFRTVETRYLEDISKSSSKVVVALGGGAFTIERNRQIISNSGTSVWLNVPFDICWSRISNTGQVRPFAREKEAALARFKLRYNLYKLADVEITVTTEKTPERITEEILTSLKGN